MAFIIILLFVRCRYLPTYKLGIAYIIMIYEQNSDEWRVYRKIIQVLNMYCVLYNIIIKVIILVGYNQQVYNLFSKNVYVFLYKIAVYNVKELSCVRFIGEFSRRTYTIPIYNNVIGKQKKQKSACRIIRILCQMPATWLSWRGEYENQYIYRGFIYII